MKPSKIHFAATTLTPGQGGICRVARLLMHSLNHWAAENNGSITGTVLQDKAAPNDAPFPIKPCAGSRLKFFTATHAAAYDADYFFYDFLGIARAHCRVPGLNRPFATYMHGIECWENARPDRLLWAKRSHLLLAHTQSALTRIRKLHGNFEKVQICWPATETDQPPLKKNASPHPPRVLILSRLSREEDYKGHRQLIGIWHKVVQSVPNAVLTIAGTGNALTDYQKQAAASPAGRQIEFLGFVLEKDLDELWAQTDIFAMPSRNEGFGLVYIEAMRHSLPVIAGIHDAGSEVNLEGETGYNIDLDQPHMLAERLIQLLQDPAKRKTMGEAGYKRWYDHFRYACFRERFFNILQKTWP